MREVVCERHAGPDGSWELVRAAPAPALSGAVARYTGWRERTPAPVWRVEVPVLEVPLILSFGPPTLVRDPAFAASAGVPPESVVSFAGGLYGRAVGVGHDGEGDAVQVDLSPLAAMRVLGLPLGELSHRTVELSALVGADAPRLVEALADAPDWPARFDLLDAVLTRRLAGAPPLVLPIVARALQRLVETRGTIAVGALAAELGCSRRYLTARMQAQLGLAPKTVARIVRFHHALGLLDGGLGWSRIAHECGYADQPHLNREFRDLAGATPTELAAARRAPFPSVQDEVAAGA